MTFHESPTIINPSGKHVAKRHYESSIKGQYKDSLRIPILKKLPNSLIFNGEMWHATNEENAEKILYSNTFKPSKYSSEDLDIPPDFGVGSYFDLSYGNVGQYGEVILKVKTKRPLVLYEVKTLSDKGFVQSNYKQLSIEGYDGAIYRAGREPENEIVIFNPENKVIPLYDVNSVDIDNAYVLKYSITN